MLELGNLVFANPFVLLALLALPVLWALLRASPPAPVRQVFPAIRLLIGLKDEAQVNTRTPWWLLLLRTVLVASAIFAFAKPSWRTSQEQGNQLQLGQNPVLLLVDDGWSSAQDWSIRSVLAYDIVSPLEQLVAVVGRAAEVKDLQFIPATDALVAIDRLSPLSWGYDASDLDWLQDLPPKFDTVWIADGLDWPENTQLQAALLSRGRLHVLVPERNLLALSTPNLEADQVSVGVQHLAHVDHTVPYGVTLQAIGSDPGGVERVLAEKELIFTADKTVAEVLFELPLEQQNRLQRIVVQGQNHAGAVQLVGSTAQRSKVGLVAGDRSQSVQDLLSPLHYLSEAIAPQSTVVEGSLLDVLRTAPDVVVLADVASFLDDESSALRQWLEAGGMLIRFAGPQMSQTDFKDPFLPVGLREGGRRMGGAMSWSEPKGLADFPEHSPFSEITVPEDIVVSRQILAQPDADLADHVIATLQDGTPLVTQKGFGDGRVVLFHVTATAQWSNLPLSGLFVDMLERLLVRSGGRLSHPEDGLEWRFEIGLDGFGHFIAAAPKELLPSAKLSLQANRSLPAGLYTSPQGQWPVNAWSGVNDLQIADWPEELLLSPQDAVVGAYDLSGIFLAMSILCLSLDGLITLRLSGNLGWLFVILCSGMFIGNPHAVTAQNIDDDAAIRSSMGVSFAYVLTGNSEQDHLSDAGLRGLGAVLRRRTNIDAALPVGIDLEVDELAFYPLIYWPVNDSQPLPSAQAIHHLREYLFNGGMVLFDTRDGGFFESGDVTPAMRRFQAIAAPLNLPSLEVLPEGHVLGRSFYLINDGPGRYAAPVWVERGGQRMENGQLSQPDSMDGVSSVIIGSNDWAAAWAIDEEGNRLLPVGRGAAGERQREMSMRFGINLVMYALTGNYKADQVHVPAFLDRLGDKRHGN